MIRIETQIQEAIANLPKSPKGHQPFVSKKKEARRKREEEARRLAELRDASPWQIEFTNTEPKPVTQAAQTQFDLDELEREMRAQLGLAAPAPAVAKPVPPPKPIAKPVKQVVKHRLEVILQVARADGSEIPFYHCDTGISKFVAEMNAARKARGYGLTVLSTISVTPVEFTCSTSNASSTH